MVCDTGCERMARSLPPPSVTSPRLVPAFRLSINIAPMFLAWRNAKPVTSTAEPLSVVVTPPAASSSGSIHSVVLASTRLIAITTLYTVSR